MSGCLLSVCPPVANKLLGPAGCGHQSAPQRLLQYPSTQQVLRGSSQISESYADSNLQLVIMIIDTVQRVEPVFAGRAHKANEYTLEGHMTAQTAAGSGMKEETRSGLGPALAARTRCASKPASAAWVGTAAASRESLPAGTQASPGAPTAGRCGRRAAPRLASAWWAWPAAGGGHSLARGCARLGLEFQYKQGPRLDRRVFPFFLRSTLPSVSSPLRGASVRQPGGGGSEQCAGKCSRGPRGGMAGAGCAEPWGCSGMVRLSSAPLRGGRSPAR